jgi:hypothetical protein
VKSRVTTDRRRLAYLKNKAKAYYQAAGFLALDGYLARSRFLNIQADKATEELHQLSARLDPTERPRNDHHD